MLRFVNKNQFESDSVKPEVVRSVPQTEAEERLFPENR